MQVEILATGDEIRTGALVDRNSAYIADILTQHGFEITRQHAVGDDREDLSAVFTEISQRADIAVVTGGLGPTDDDLTSQIAASVAAVPLALDPRALEDIEQFFAKHNRSMSPSNRKQAYLPLGAKALYNTVGTAPGFQLKIDQCLFFCLPGVPPEMQKMLAEQVMPALLALQGDEPHHCFVKTLSTFGLPESIVGERVSALNAAFPDIKLGLRARFPEIQVKLYLNTTDQKSGAARLAKAVDWVKQRLGIYLFSDTGQNMATTVGTLLTRAKATVALAESCTGGLIANWLTNVPGASDYFLFAGVTYANDAKINVLGVSADTLAQCGAVHEQTAREMAVGARNISVATYGLAVTGIAGPTGGTDDKPVGTVCIAVAGPAQTVSRRLFYPFGQRLMNKRIFATAALDLLRRTLLPPVASQ